MKKSLTIIFLLICGVVINALVVLACGAALSYSNLGLGAGIFAGAIAVMIFCRLAVSVRKRLQIRRRTMLLCLQLPSFAISAPFFVKRAVEYYNAMTQVQHGGQHTLIGYPYGYTVYFFGDIFWIFVSVSVMTAALALVFGYDCFKEKYGGKRAASSEQLI